MDDWDCLENSCTLRGTVGSNPTLSVDSKRLIDHGRGERLASPRQVLRLIAHLHQHGKRHDKGVFRNLDFDSQVVVAQVDCQGEQY